MTAKSSDMVSQGGKALVLPILSKDGQSLEDSRFPSLEAVFHDLKDRRVIS